MVVLRLRYVYRDFDRHGNPRVYFWRGKGHRKIRLRDPVDSPEFRAAYDAALKAGETPPPDEAYNPTKPGKPGTMKWLRDGYVASGVFLDMEESSQRVRKGILDAMMAEPIRPGDAKTFGMMPIPKFSSKSVRVLRDRKKAFPHAAIDRLKALRRMFSWALEEEVEGVTSNPARDVARPQTRKGGHHTWTIEEIEQYEARWAVGTKARLALDMFLYLGLRISDAARLGRQHRRGDWLKFTAFKGRKRHPMTLELPILPVLAESVARGPTGDLTFLVTEYGRPFSIKGLGNKMREWCDAASLPQCCTAHGLRKAGATRAAENGATPHQLMAIFGWMTLKQAEDYTRAARQKKMAGESMGLLARRDER